MVNSYRNSCQFLFPVCRSQIGSVNPRRRLCLLLASQSAPSIRKSSFTGLIKLKQGFQPLFRWARSLAKFTPHRACSGAGARDLALVLCSKKDGKKSKIKEPTTELKTNRLVLRELFEDIKQYKKLIKII